MVGNSDTGFSFYGIKTLDDYTWSLIQESICDPTLKWEQSKIYLGKDDDKGLIIAKDIPKNISKRNDDVGGFDDKIRRSEHAWLRKDERLGEVIEKMVNQHFTEAYILNDEKKFLGKINLTKILNEDRNGTISNYIDSNPLVIKHDASLMQAIELASSFVGESIPVINLTSQQFMGVVSEADIFKGYLERQNQIRDLEA